MARVIFLSNGTLATSSGATGTNSLTPGLPTGVAAGDCMIAAVCVRRANSNTISTPATWTKLFQANAGTTFTSAVYWKVANGTDTAPNFTWSTANVCSAIVAAFRGTDPVWPVGNVGAVSVAAASANLNITALTTNYTNSYVIAVGTNSLNNASTNAYSWTEDLESTGAGNRTKIVINGRGYKESGNVTAQANIVTGSGNSVGIQIELIARMEMDPVVAGARVGNASVTVNNALTLPQCNCMATAAGQRISMIVNAAGYGSWTVPANVSTITVEAWGAGAGESEG